MRLEKYTYICLFEGLKIFNIMFDCYSQGICLLVFNAHENWVRCVVFHPSGKFILSSSDDKTIRVMDIKVLTCCWYFCCAF